MPPFSCVWDVYTLHNSRQADFRPLIFRSRRRSRSRRALGGKETFLQVSLLLCDTLLCSSCILTVEAALSFLFSSGGAAISGLRSDSLLSPSSSEHLARLRWQAETGSGRLSLVEGKTVAGRRGRGRIIVVKVGSYSFLLETGFETKAISDLLNPSSPADLI
jgi:hypothetical protein